METSLDHCVDHNQLWKILKEMGILNHLTCLLRKLYAGQEAAIRTKHGTMDGLNIGKGLYIGTLRISLVSRVHHAKSGLDETQDGIKIVERNTNNLRYAYDTTLMA